MRMVADSMDLEMPCSTDQEDQAEATGSVPVAPAPLLLPWSLSPACLVEDGVEGESMYEAEAVDDFPEGVPIVLLLLLLPPLDLFRAVI